MQSSPLSLPLLCHRADSGTSNEDSIEKCTMSADILLTFQTITLVLFGGSEHVNFYDIQNDFLHPFSQSPYMYILCIHRVKRDHGNRGKQALGTAVRSAQHRLEAMYYKAPQFSGLLTFGGCMLILTEPSTS